MPQTDDQLLAFDTSDLGTGTRAAREPPSAEGTASCTATTCPSAWHLASWAEDEGRRADVDAYYKTGYRQVLQDMAAFLRQTYYLPRGLDRTPGDARLRADPPLAYRQAPGTRGDRR